jgi:hypothetical protein
MVASLELYKKWLGLEYTRRPGGQGILELTFTRVDPDDASRQFYFLIFVNDQNKYVDAFLFVCSLVLLLLVVWL